MADAVGQRMLLVEDEALIALAERRVLESAGYTVTVVHTGEDAVQAVRESDAFDLVLMDIDLGAGIDGTEATTRILAIRDLPVVFLSSHTEADIVTRTEAITSYGYILKHSGATVLLASIRMAFQLWDAHRKLELVNRENARTSTYLTAILEANPGGFLVVDTDGYIQDANTAYLRMTGFSRDELLGQHVSERDIEEDGTAARQHIEEILDGRERRFFAHHLRKDGSSVPLDISVQTIDTDAGPALISFCHDLSELHGARELIAEEEQLRKDLIAQVPGAIYQFQYFPDGSSRFPIASPNIWLVYEVTPEEVAEDATAAFQRVHPDDHDDLVASIVHSRDTLKDWEHDYRVVLPSRGERWLRGRARPEALEDGSVLWHGFITDITERKQAEHTLQEQSRRYQSVIEGTNVGTWEWNVQTGETVFNKRWATIVGYTLEDLQPTTIKTWTDRAHPDDLRQSEEALRAHFAGEQEFYDVTARMRHRDGHWVWVHDRGKVFTWTPEGEPEWVYGTHQDVSDAVAYREQLEQSETNFRAFFDTSPDFLWVLDASGSILDVNRTVTDRLGYTKEELIGRSVLSVHPKERREEAGRIVAEMLEGVRDTCPVPIVARDGRRIPVETTVKSAVWNGESALFGVSRDISDLAYSEEKYARMVGNIPALVGLSDSDTGTFVEVNDAFCSVLGFERDEVVGARSVDLIRLDPKLRDRMNKSMDLDGTFTQLETTICTKTGEPVDVLLSGSRIEVQDRQYNLVTATDIRKRKQAERERERAMTAQKTLMAELNHRVKNNLAMVVSLIRLKSTEGPSTIDLSDLESRVQAIATLHEELQASAELDRVAVKSYVERVVGHAFSGASLPVEVHLDIADEEIPTRTATTLGLIINELATNAVKHGFDRDADARFSLALTCRDGCDELVVRNSGRRFPDDVTIETSNTMGLQLVTSLVQQLGGELRLERSPDTTFFITYPHPSLGAQEL